MGSFGTVNMKIFAGLLAVLPILGTIYLVYWGVASIEGGLGALLELFLPEGVYRPGLGLLAGLGIILLVGTLVEIFVVRELLGWFEKLI